MKQNACAVSGSTPVILAADESERVLGKSIEHEYNLADLLRRPNVSYGGLMSLDHGKYANRDLLDNCFT